MNDAVVDRRLRERFEATHGVPPFDPDAVIADVGRRLARRRRRRVAAFGAGVLVVVLAAVGTAIVATDGDSAQELTTAPVEEPTPLSDGAVNLVTVGWREGPQLADPVTGNASPLGPDLGSDWQWCNTCLVVRVGDRAFTAQNGRLFSFTPGDGTLRDVAAADRVIKPAEGDRLFVEIDGRIEQRSADGSTTVAGPWDLPAGYDLTEQPQALSRGFVVSNKSEFIGDLAWWDPSTGIVEPLGEYNHFIGAHSDAADGPDRLAWTVCPARDFPCSLVLSDADGSNRLVIEPPVEGNGFYLGGAFSPDGALLATTVSMHPGTTNPDAALAIVDTQSGAASVIDGTRFGVGEPYGYVTWSPDGSTVFFTGDNGVRAYATAEQQVQDLPFPGTYYSVAAVPALDRSRQCPDTEHPWQRGPRDAPESGDGLPPTETATEDAATASLGDGEGTYVWAEPGRAHSQSDDGTIDIVDEIIYTVVVELASENRCPRAPAFANGVPLTYLVVDR